MVQSLVKLRFFCLLICGVALIFFSNRQRMMIPSGESDDRNTKDYKYILTWTPDSGNVKLKGWSYPDLEGFKQAGCAEYRCYLTDNRSYLGRFAIQSAVKCAFLKKYHQVYFL